MKRFIIAALFLFIAGGALAEGVDVHVVVYLDPAIAGVTAAEFKVEGLPIGPCAVEATWNTDLVIGDVSTGIALAFNPPLVPAGYLVHLGTLHVTCFEPIADEHLLCVRPTDDTGVLVIVDEQFVMHDAHGLAHRFNTEYLGWCECYNDPGSRNASVFMLLADPQDTSSCGQDMPVETTASDPSAWSVIKALY